uniref:Uncharacterized protein n=1 Tax=Oryza punctata TaxID=4537 RepID=A0A0E0LJ51_ORYPU
MRRWRGGHASKLVAATDLQAISMWEDGKITGESLAIRASNGDACGCRFLHGALFGVNYHALSNRVLQVKTTSWFLKAGSGSTRCHILFGGIV